MSAWLNYQRLLARSDHDMRCAVCFHYVQAHRLKPQPSAIRKTTVDPGAEVSICNNCVKKHFIAKTPAMNEFRIKEEHLKGLDCFKYKTKPSTYYLNGDVMKLAVKIKGEASLTVLKTERDKTIDRPKKTVNRKKRAVNYSSSDSDSDNSDPKQQTDSDDE